MTPLLLEALVFLKVSRRYSGFRTIINDMGSQTTLVDVAACSHRNEGILQTEKSDIRHRVECALIRKGLSTVT